MSHVTIRQKVFAWLLKKTERVNEKIYGEIKAKLFEDLHGTIVEIGPGTGVNFRYFPNDVSWIGLEPNQAFHEGMKLKARSFGIEGTLVGSSAENIDLPDESADVVVSTLVLCSVKDLSSTMEEIKRILKKNGRLIFVEHVAAPENTRLRKAQQILNPINRIIADGCNCNRETWRTIENAGFASTNFVHKMIKGTPSIHAPHIIGSATK